MPWLLGLQGMLHGQTLQAPSEPGSEHEQQLWPGLLGEQAREPLSRWQLRSLAGPTNFVASPATDWQEGPVQLHGVKRFLPARLPSVSH